MVAFRQNDADETSLIVSIQMMTHLVGIPQTTKHFICLFGWGAEVRAILPLRTIRNMNRRPSLIFQNYLVKTKCCDVQKTAASFGKDFFGGFLMGIVPLAFLSMNGFAAEVQGGKKAEQPTGNQQREKMYLQEGL
jgi:hypothetical protein